VVFEEDEEAHRMNADLLRRLPGFVMAAAVSFMPATVRACSVCMGDANSNAAGAANGAIFLMLGVIGAMLAATAGFGFYIYKRANTPLPPHLQLVEEMNDEDRYSHA
jgi:hypothetical protein